MKASQSISALRIELQKFIMEQMAFYEAHPLRSKRNILTIGIEHEFFLETKAGKPVSNFESQLFLRHLAEKENWYIQDEGLLESTNFIRRVSLENGRNRFTAVKYDHHPHLLEIAFAYQDNIEDLYSLVSQTFETLNEVAVLTNTVISNSPFSSVPASDPRLLSNLQEFKDLRHYRALLFNQRNEKHSLEQVNYAAGIAATQVHIGGLSWWKDPSLVSKIYCFEPSLLSHTAKSSAKYGKDLIDFLKRRWSGYIDVFKGFPLVGFPNIEEWNIDSWCDALLSSPLYGGKEDLWSGLSVKAMEQNPFGNWSLFMKSVRDLQVIRPKLFGTLEFRADPSQPDTKKIIALAALRLGICQAVQNGVAPILNFKDAYREWWECIKGQKIPTTFDVLEISQEGLASRNMKEKQFLKELY